MHNNNIGILERLCDLLNKLLHINICVDYPTTNTNITNIIGRSDGLTVILFIHTDNSIHIRKDMVPNTQPLERFLTICNIKYTNHPFTYVFKITDIPNTLFTDNMETLIKLI